MRRFMQPLGWSATVLALALLAQAGPVAAAQRAAKGAPSAHAAPAHKTARPKVMSTSLHAAPSSRLHAAAGRHLAGLKGRKGRPRGPVEITMPSPPAATIAPLQAATVHTGCLGAATDSAIGYSATELQGWLGAKAEDGAAQPCRHYASVSLAGTATRPDSLALLAFSDTRALLVTAPRDAAPEPATRWVEIDTGGSTFQEVWLPSTLGAGTLEAVPAPLQNELALLVRLMRKQSAAPTSALLRVWLQGGEEAASIEALELVDPLTGQAYDSAVWLARGDAPGAYVSSHGVEYERMLWQSPVDHLRVSRGIGASSMLVRKRVVVKTHARRGRARTRVVVQSFVYKGQHVGIDFAAPMGTPVVAVADGEIEFAGWRGGYGNLILLRHGDELSTYYGHLSAFAPGLQPGLHVRRGQAIGLVGSTGFSTGPHLHFEIRKDGRYIDPTRPDVQLPAWTLQGDEHPLLLTRLLQLDATRLRSLPGAAVQPAS